MVHHGPPTARSHLATGRSTPLSIKIPARSSSRTRSLQPGFQGNESPMGSPHRSSSRLRDGSSYRHRDTSPTKSIHTAAQQAEGEAVCNYDTNVTNLYELLESSNWEKAKSRCRTHPHEVRTWIVRRDSISQKVRWKLLPLHAAVIFQSPTFVVSALIDHYPEAVARRDDQGMLPLHLAFRYKEDNEDLLELLLGQYPKGVLMKDKRDRTPLEHGRGSKFSAKLMRLYAEVTVSGSRGLSMNGDSPVGTPSKTRDLHFESATRAEHETKTKTLKSMFEERIKMIHEQHKTAMNQLRISCDDEKRKLINVHVEELEAMRELMNSNVGTDEHLIIELQTEINHLRSELLACQEEKEAVKFRSAEVTSFADGLALQLRQLLQDHDAMQQLLVQQQQQLDQAHSRREQLIQKLLRQELEERPNRERNGSDIKQLVESVRVGIESLLSPHPGHSEPKREYQMHLTNRESSVNYRAAANSNHLPGNTLKDDISAITENSNF